MNRPRLSLVVIRSSDINKARRFYETLGLTFTEHKHGTGSDHLASEHEQFVFEIYPLKESQTPTTSTRLGFSVDSCDEVSKKLHDAGFVLRSKPDLTPWGRVAVAEDFDGHKVEIIQKII